MTVLVQHDKVLDSRYPSPIRVDSDFWFEWLEKERSFRYECENGNISVIKDSRNYWTASKKVKGGLRRKRLGVSQSITHQKLRDAVSLLCLDGCWKEYQQEKEMVFQVKKKEAETIEQLKIKIADLEANLAKVSQIECDTQAIDKVRAVINRYKSEAKNNSRWYWANKMIADLDQAVE